MIAMTSVLERGYTYWDRALLPRDEFEERTRAAQRSMEAADLVAIVVWSQSYHTNGDLAFLSGAPLGGVLLLTREGEPALFSADGGREQYFQRMQTWIEDMRSTTAGIGKIIAETLKGRGLTNGKVGVVGFDLMSAAALQEFSQALANFELTDYEGQYRALRTPKRPREVLAIKRSLEIARKAVQAGERAFAANGTNAEALIEAERIARVEGARDFRGLANLRGKQLRPFERLSADRNAPLILWVAVDHHGYWADAASQGAVRSPADAAVDAMVAMCRPGAPVGALAEAGLSELPAEARAGALSYGFGSGCGLSLDEWPVIEPGSSATLAEGSIIALRAYCMDGKSASLRTALIHIRSSEAIRL
jgi:Xaa-Pro aminopeptidase